MTDLQNPILPGFYPDPSILRVGEKYYIVNSSFEYFPGVPLSVSSDLTHWRPSGFVLTRKSQLLLEGCRPSGGIYAPTLRRIHGKYVMITTNETEIGTFYVVADDIHGPWSEPVRVLLPDGSGITGIDPSLFEVADGRVYFQNAWCISCKGIAQAEIDFDTGKLLSPPRTLWIGSGGRYPEGPHLYRINGWYYLLLAEGGTEYGHMVTIARSKSVWGPFEGHPHNPILSHKDTEMAWTKLQATGHADLFEDARGNWWMVFHAIRPSTGMLHHLGRETCLAPVTWADGWPCVNDGQWIQTDMNIKQALPASQADVTAPKPLCDYQNGHFQYLRNPDEECYSFLPSGGVALRANEHVLDDFANPTAILMRQQQFDIHLEVSISDLQLSADGQAGLTAYHTGEYHYDLFVEQTKAGRFARLRKRVDDMICLSQPCPIEGDSVVLTIEADMRRYRFLANGKEVGTGVTRLLSSELMDNGFTGVFVGPYVQGKGTTASFSAMRLGE